jgi:hypothetical protein
VTAVERNAIGSGVPGALTRDLRDDYIEMLNFETRHQSA